LSDDGMMDRLGRKLTKRASRLRRRLYWAWRNVVSESRMVREIDSATAPIADLTRYEKRMCSQHGEDGILEAIFRKIGTTNRYCVEFGVGSGR
jgi:hypothetical protein